MTPSERSEIMLAMSKAVEAFDKSMKDWNIRPLIRIEVREVRYGDFSLGESITIDEIKEYIENKQCTCPDGHGKPTH